MLYHLPCVGGLDNWQKYLTLPNILKNFNPQLKGMSLHITEGYSGEIDGYNFALTGAKTFNMSSQAYRMMQKMRADPSIDFEKDWKMVTILIGHNDLCSVVCQRSSLDSITETQHLIEALDMLYYDMPRTFVNLMPISGAEIIFPFDFRHFVYVRFASLHDLTGFISIASQFCLFISRFIANFPLEKNSAGLLHVEEILVSLLVWTLPAK